MKEIVYYFESEKSGILGLTQVKPGWVELTKKINTRTKFKPTDIFVDETVSSWIQIERCMALTLSRELGIFVRSGNRKFKDDLSGRLKKEQKELADNYNIESIFKIEGAASQLILSANFDLKTIEYSSELLAPLDKQNRGKISWLKRQLAKSESKNEEVYKLISDNIFIEINYKFSKNSTKIKLLNLDSDSSLSSDKEIKGFNVIYVLSMGQKFEQRKIILDLIEENLMYYYQGVMQHLKKWEKPAPQIIIKDDFNDSEENQIDKYDEKTRTFDDKVGNVLTNWKKKEI